MAQAIHFLLLKYLTTAYNGSGYIYHQYQFAIQQYYYKYYLSQLTSISTSQKCSVWRWFFNRNASHISQPGMHLWFVLLLFIIVFVAKTKFFHFFQQNLHMTFIFSIYLTLRNITVLIFYLRWALHLMIACFQKISPQCHLLVPTILYPSVIPVLLHGSPACVKLQYWAEHVQFLKLIQPPLNFQLSQGPGWPFNPNIILTLEAWVSFGRFQPRTCLCFLWPWDPMLQWVWFFGMVAAWSPFWLANILLSSWYSQVLTS